MTRPEQSVSVALPHADDLRRGVSLALIGRRFVRHGIEDLPPSYFSLVMATGIVSLSSQFLGFYKLANLLVIINVWFILLLFCLNVARIIFFRTKVLDDLGRHAVSPGYFTIVAGTSVFGQQLLSIANYGVLASWMWFFAIFLWLVTTYAIFTALIICPSKPSLKRGLGGVWLISAVATQSISVLGALVASQFPSHQEIVLFVSATFFMMGCILYINIIALIFFRLTFIYLDPVEMTPSFWINMGATAIATQAGSTLMLLGNQSQRLADLLPFIRGFTLFFWSAGTWWIPLLIILGLWAHLVRRVPITYSPQLWGMVFPVGMYTASTYQMALATGFDFLLVIPKVSVILALSLWCVTFAGLLRELGRGVLPSAGR